jgi:chromosome segregation ATPase
MKNYKKITKDRVGTLGAMRKIDFFAPPGIDDEFEDLRTEISRALADALKILEKRDTNQLERLDDLIAQVDDLEDEQEVAEETLADSLELVEDLGDQLQEALSENKAIRAELTNLKIQGMAG